MKLSLIPLKTLIPLLFSVFSLLITSVFVVHDITQSSRQMHEEYLNNVTQIMSTLQGTINHLLAQNDLQGAHEIMNQYATDLSIETLGLLNSNNQVIFSNQLQDIDRRAETLLTPQHLRMVANAIKHQTGIIEFDSTDSYVLAAAEVTLDNQAGTLRPNRTGVLYLSYDLSRIMAAKRSRLYNDMRISLLTIVLLTAVLWYIFHLILSRRVESLLASTRALARGDLSHRVCLTGRDELSEIARALNHMAIQLEHDRHSLETSQKRLRTILDNVIDGIVTISPNGIIQDFNPAAEHIFGQTRANVIGHNIKMLMPEPFHSAHDGYLQNYLESGQRKIIGFLREVEGQRADGSTFPLELWVTEIWLDHERLFIGMVRDISERREVTRLKNEFVANVSHELRTPLTSINGSLKLMRNGVLGEVGEQAKAMLDIAEKNSDRLILLINDLLDIEKIESGNMDFDFTEVDLATLLQEAIEANRGYADSLSVNYLLHSPLPTAIIQGDQHRLLQVMANLLTNACKFSSSHATVELSLQLADNNTAEICVEDHGCGIPDEFHPRIFQKFAQADGSSSRHHGGTGLGLSISKAIVERHGGNIRFESAAKLGTRFYITLPIFNSHASP